MPKTVSYGGQMRTFTGSCGWSRRGSPLEVHNLFVRHRRYCPSCSEIEYEYEPFSNASGMVNGWRNDYASANTRRAVIQSSEGTFDIHLSGVSTSEQAVNELIDMANAEGIPTEDAEVISKSKKRRIKLKARKEAKKQNETDK